MSRFGLYRVHVIRMGGPVDSIRWIAERVGNGRLEGVLEYEEVELGVHHLRLYWKENATDNNAKCTEVFDERQ